ncbi:hypothetical protein pEaSNUABM30_00244 [Erwinia phage pEa_SNUABM_30]|uniref:Uncharacterized protein n=1 Tax=Erwinia phage pEa_SNUABM_30 TaxID=2869553 RepID=A0AAE8XL01_9CAUD|nr:hypothetical protein MPK69_gp244 [Erwinia phage pEa_SNUABM_30]UAW53362.1 hypothetical protein pEaSNUABM30_00244 [Erwinia phage pEa_SNUABM_30]
MSLIKIEGIASTSAPTKAQKDAAVYLFGSKGHSIVAVLDKFSRAKELRTAHLDGLLKLMKEGEDDEIIKFAASTPGKKTIANAKAFAVAKTLTAAIKALKLIRVPVKWVEGHSDAAAARAQETKEIRARKTAGNKPEKPIKLDNPGAPEAEDVSPAALFDAALKNKNKAPFEAVNKAVAASVKQFGLKTELDLSKRGKAMILIKLGRGIEGTITFPSNTRKLDWPHDDPNQFYLSAQNAEEMDVVMDYVPATFKNAPKTIAKAFESLWEKAMRGENGDLPVSRPGKKATRTKKSEPAANPKAPLPYTPSGKSDITLVDELAEVTARKISAKPLQAREEYFNALRNTLHSNLRNSVVNTTSDGVTVAMGSKLYTIRLADNTWTIQTGATGKPKKIGATFDIVDVLGMIDKSILRPKG